MGIKVMADSGGQVTYNSAEIGAMFNTFSSNSDYIIQGIGDQMSVTTSASSLVITVHPGRAVVNGRMVDIPSNTDLTVPAGLSNVYLVVKIDLSQPVGSEGYLTYCLSNQLRTDNLNNGGTQHDLVLGSFSTNSGGVTSYTDRRTIKSTSAVTPPTYTAGSGIGISNYVISNIATWIARSGAIDVQTSAPTGNNTTGVKVCYLTSNPGTKYSGWIYLIKQ